jgi:hypothetical protein
LSRVVEEEGDEEELRGLKTHVVGDEDDESGEEEGSEEFEMLEAHRNESRSGSR